MAKTKKNENVVVYNETQELGNINTQELLEKFENLSMRGIAAALELSASRLVKLQHAPVAGQVYDPTAINFEALNEYINKRRTPEQIDAIEWQEFEKVAREAKEYDLSVFTIGSKVTFKNDDKEYIVVYATPTHIALECDNELVARSARRMKSLQAKVVTEEAK